VAVIGLQDGEIRAAVAHEQFDFAVRKLVLLMQKTVFEIGPLFNLATQAKHFFLSLLLHSCGLVFIFQVLNRCASANWSERKEGLLGLQALLKNQRTLRSVAGHTNVFSEGKN